MGNPSDLYFAATACTQADSAIDSMVCSVSLPGSSPSAPATQYSFAAICSVVQPLVGNIFSFSDQRQSALAPYPCCTCFLSKAYFDTSTSTVTVTGGVGDINDYLAGVLELVDAREVIGDGGSLLPTLELQRKLYDHFREGVVPSP